jgi:hypothetical protein
MVVVVKDGILQLICKPCECKYARVAHVYKNTEYAHRNGYHAGIK